MKLGLHFPLFRELASAGASADFEVVVSWRYGTDPELWRQAGATSCLTGWPANVSLREVLAAARSGPPQVLDQ